MARFVSDRRIALLLVIYTLAIASWLLLAGVRVTLEDGFYYFGVAEHLAQGHGSTYDGHSQTNGYHPLWLLTLVPVFWLTPGPEWALLLGTAVQALLTSAAVVLIYYTARLRTGRLSASLAALLWLWITWPIALGGLEFSVHALGLLAVGYVYLRWFAGPLPDGPRLYLGLGVLLSLTFLARLDTILLSAVLVSWLSWREYGRGVGRAAFTRLLALSLPVVLVSLSYVATNLHVFGHAAPVSGVIKRTWSNYLLSQDPTYSTYGWLAAKAVNLVRPFRDLDQPGTIALLGGTAGVAVIWLIGSVAARRVRPGGRLRSAVSGFQPFVLFSLLSFIGYAVIYHAALSFPPWYFVAQPWLASLVLATLVDAYRPQGTSTLMWPAERHMADIVKTGLCCTILIGTVWGLHQRRIHERDGSSPQPLHDGAAWVAENLPPSSVIGAWNAGAIGYLSTQRVVNLDGLVNSWAFFEDERHDLCGYWRKEGITHLVDIFDHRAPAIGAVVPEPQHRYYARCAGDLELVWSDDRHQDSWWRLEAYRIRR